MKLLWIALLAAAGGCAQNVCVGVVSLDNGIHVGYSLYGDGIRGAALRSRDIADFCGHETGPGFLRRVLKIREGLNFGYELHVTRNPPGRKPFHVAVTPIDRESMQYFPRSPKPVDVGSNDTVEFVLFTLENSDGYVRFVERFHVTDQTDARALATTAAAESIPPDLTPLALRAPRVTREGRPIASLPLGEVAGSTVWLYVPGLGRLWLTTHWKDSFPRTVSTHGNRLEFRWDGVTYAVECSQPLIDLPGNWNIWMRLEPGWKPASNDFLDLSMDPNVIIMGSMGG